MIINYGDHTHCKCDHPGCLGATKCSSVHFDWIIPGINFGMDLAVLASIERSVRCVFQGFNFCPPTHFLFYRDQLIHLLEGIPDLSDKEEMEPGKGCWITIIEKKVQNFQMAVEPFEKTFEAFSSLIKEEGQKEFKQWCHSKGIIPAGTFERVEDPGTGEVLYKQKPL